MTIKRFLLFALVFAWFGKDGQSQGTTCFQTGTFTTATSATVLDNRLPNTPGCTSWLLTYFSTGFSALSIEVDGAPDSSGVAGVFVAVPSSVVILGSNPSTTLQSVVSFPVYYPWIKVKTGSVTGSGTIYYTLRGYNTAASGGRGAGGGGSVFSVFGRFGNVVAASGDYNTSQVTELTNLYYTNARARAALSVSTPLTYNSSTGAIGTNLNATLPITFNSTTGAIGTNINATSPITFNATTGAIACPTCGTGATGGQTTRFGTYANLPASATTAGNEYITTDSSYRFYWNGSSWSALYMGTPVTLPPAVSTLTWVNQSTATADETLGGIYLSVPANGSPALRSLVKTLPSCPGGSTFTVGLQHFMQGANFVHNGIFIRASATDKTIVFGPGYNGGYQVAVDYYTNNTTFSSAPKEQFFHTLPLWYRVVDDCTNFSFQYSYDGSNFLVFYSASRTAHTAVPNQIGIGADSENNFITALRVFHWAGI